MANRRAGAVSVDATCLSVRFNHIVQGRALPTGDVGALVALQPFYVRPLCRTLLI